MKPLLREMAMTDNDDLIAWNRATTKWQLDLWLMARYDIDHSMARTISNNADTPYRSGFGGLHWIGKGLVPTFEQYPDLTIENTLRALREKDWKHDVT